MGTHNISMSCIAHEEINQYAIVKLHRGDYELPHVEMCDNTEDVIFGVCLVNAEAGDLVAIRFPFSGILPAYAYGNVRPGDGLTIGLATPGSMSNNDAVNYARKIAYVVQSGPIDVDPSKCAVVFTRAYYR